MGAALNERDAPMAVFAFPKELRDDKALSPGRRPLLCPTCARNLLSAEERDRYGQCEECAENEARSFWAI